MHIDRDSSDGFVRGKAKIKEIVPEKESSVKSGRLVVLEFQNEFLAAREDSSSSSSSSLLACCPDLICLMDTTTGAPIYNEEIRFSPSFFFIPPFCCFLILSLFPSFHLDMDRGSLALPFLPLAEQPLLRVWKL